MLVDLDARVRNLNLGLRLGVLCAVAIVATMALLTGIQLAMELHAELTERQAVLGRALDPISAELAEASSLAELRTVVERSGRTYAQRRGTAAVLELRRPSGEVVSRSGSWPETAPIVNELTASRTLPLPRLGPGASTLQLTVPGDAFHELRQRRWRDWTIHVLVTAGLIVLVLFVIVRREVSVPVDRLLRSIHKMEMGYWDDIPDPGGAWELRWLAWRFRSMSLELNKTMGHLVAAQQRAYIGREGRRSAVDEQASKDSQKDSTDDSPLLNAIVRRLEASLETLRSASGDDPEALTLARTVWDRYAATAARLGRFQLHCDLEDAALGVLDPLAFQRVATAIAARRPALDEVTQTHRATIEFALTARGITVVEVQGRVKHAAGVWKKMQLKDLEFDQVHDLAAIRVVVPTASDCYHALGVLQQLYVQIIPRFKDYIARPKANGYQGLHLTVRDQTDTVFEIQVRSAAMHRCAESGAAAHVDYKATELPVLPGRRNRWWTRLARATSGMTGA